MNLTDVLDKLANVCSSNEFNHSTLDTRLLTKRTIF